jgi:putative transposase
VERNGLRAGLVGRAEEWRFGSLWRWRYGSAEQKRLLSVWPIPRLTGWVDHVNAPLTEGELAAVRQSIRRGRPYGNPRRIKTTTRRLGVETTLRPRGRPTKGS